MEKTGFSRRAEENSGIFTWSVEFSRNAAVAAEKWLWLTSFIYLYWLLFNPHSYSEFCPCFFVSLTWFVLFFTFRSWLHSACYQCDPAEGLWGWGDSWGKWWKVQSRLHQHRAPRLPQVPTPRCPPLLWRRLTWLMDVSEMFRVVWRHFHVIVCVFSPGNRRPRGTVSGFPRCPTALITWTLCRARPLSTAAGWAVTRRGPSHCGEHHAGHVEIANWWHWSILKWSLSVWRNSQLVRILIHGSFWCLTCAASTTMTQLWSMRTPRSRRCWSQSAWTWRSRVRSSGTLSPGTWTVASLHHFIWWNQLGCCSDWEWLPSAVILHHHLLIYCTFNTLLMQTTS